MKRFLTLIGALLIASAPFGISKLNESLSGIAPDTVTEVSQPLSIPDNLPDNNMEVVLSNDVICAGEEVTVQMFTRVLNASPGIQFRNIEIYNSDIDPSIDIRETFFVEESDLNENGYLDWLDLDNTDYVAPNGDLRSDEEFLHEYTRAFTETTTIIAGDQADVFLVSDVSDSESATDLNVTISAEDSATITVFNPSLSLSVEPVTRRTVVGEPTEFDITIINTGDIDLTDVKVTHEEASGCDGILRLIAAGEEYKYNCQISEAKIRTTLNVTVSSAAGDQLCMVDAAERAVISAVEPTAVPTNTSTATNTPEPTATSIPPTATNTPEPTATSIPPTVTNTPQPTATSIPPTATNTPQPTATSIPPTATNTPTATPLPPPTPIALSVNGCNQPLTSSRATLSGTGVSNTQAHLFVNSIDFATVQVGAAGEWVYGIEFSSPGQYDVYMQAFDQSGAVTAVSSPVRCVVPEPEKPRQLPATGSALMKNSETIWVTLLVSMLIGLVALYDRRKRQS